MRRNPFGPYLGVVLWGWVTTVLAFSQAPSGLRSAAVFSFALIGPGLTLIGLFRRTVLLERIVLAVATSLALDTLIGEGMALTRLWHPAAGVAILAAFATVTARLSETRRRLERSSIEESACSPLSSPEGKS